MSIIQDQRAIEEIELVVSRYARFADTKQWDKFSQLFTDDVEVDYEGVVRANPDQPTRLSIKGRDKYLGLFATLLIDWITIHQMFMPDIVITGPDTATGIWAMHDFVITPTCIFKGWGHYHHEYRKIAGTWKIAKNRTTRTHTEEKWLNQ
jgi:SnoaL-like domain